jgi:phosphatidylglycerophosphate synthase
MNEWSKILYKKVSRPFVITCVYLGITPNQITLFNHFITLTFGCYFFSRGTYVDGLLGLAICLINGFLDYLDGDVARETQQSNKLGIWLDSGFDVVIQNAVMASIAIGCFKMGLPLFVVLLFMIANSANNFVSFNYNATFGFDSEKGNQLFRDYMDQKGTWINVFFKNLIDPTSNYYALVCFTYRYFISVGIIFNIMPYLFVAITVLSNLKWFVMYSLYAMHLRGDKNLHVLNALSILDEENDAFYSARYHKNV